MSVALNFTELYNKYRMWVNRNPQMTTDFELTAKWLSYFIAGRINNSHIVSELVYCLSNLLVLCNDRIIHDLRQLNIHAKSGEKLKLWITVIEYSEVFLELSATKLWGERGRWFIILIIQVFKCITKLLLIHKYKEAIIESPVIPSLERKNLQYTSGMKKSSVSNIDMSSLGAMSFELKRSGRVIRKVEGSPPLNMRSWKPMQREKINESDAEENIQQALIERQLAAETVYLVKPLVHFGAATYFGNRNWKPYLLALLFDLCSLELYRSCKNEEHNTLTQQQKLQISKRTINLFLYLIRSPFYEKYSRDKIDRCLNNLSKKIPLASLICTPLLQYLPFWQSNYFYLWSA